MYDFHYKFIEQNYNDKTKLLFTDSDSLCYEIQTKYVYKYFWKDKKDYAENSPFSDSNNKKNRIRCFQDKAAGEIIK